MGTRDGITTEEWDIVHGLAVDIVNASGERELQYRQQLLWYLETLEQKYGPLTSILATRADYLDDDDPAREALLVRAHATAASNDDATNVVETAQSLVEMFLERRQLSEADAWLTKLRESIDLFDQKQPSYADYDALRGEYPEACPESGHSTNRHGRLTCVVVNRASRPA